MKIFFFDWDEAFNHWFSFGTNTGVEITRLPQLKFTYMLCGSCISKDVQAFQQPMDSNGIEAL